MVSTLDAKPLGPQDYVNISNTTRPKILCFDGHEPISCLVEYGRRRIRKPKVYPTTWRDFKKGRKKPVVEEETPKSVRRPHPTSEDEYVDSFLAGPSSSPSRPAGTAQDPDTDATYRYQAAVLDPSSIHAELTDPHFLSLLSRERGIDQGWTRSTEKEKR
jgi:hypothetical protein